jgi:hypothetical protein
LSNADLQFFRLGNSSVDTLDTLTPQVSVLAGGQVDGSEEGFLNQDGDSLFLQRFALSTHAGYDPVSAMKFALEHQNPLVTGEVTGGSQYPEASFSLLTIDNPNVLLWALKPAEDGISEGLVVRMWNLSGSAGSFVLTYASGPITSAKKTTHVETPIEEAVITNGQLTGPINGSQMVTFKTQIVTNPPAVTLISFEAVAQGQAVRVYWQTGSEADLVGFDLYRAETLDGLRTRVNLYRIPAQTPGKPQGNFYQYLDTSSVEGKAYYYWLDWIGINGIVLTGPISVRDPYINQVWLPLMKR